MSSQQKPLIGIGAVVVLAAIGYFIYTSDNVPSDGLTVTQENSLVTAERQTREFRNLLNMLNEVDLESDMLTDEAFLSLEDNTLPILERPFGRANPFNSTR